MRATTKRIGFIDGIRGWALFGILLANLLIFQYGIFGKDEISYFDLSSSNLFSYYFVKLFIENSFMPIFTFLFGYSLILMRNSLKKRQLRVKWHLFRRFIMLIVLGVLHSTFLWEGDILLSYGMMGILLLLFVNRKPKTLLIWAILLLSFITVGSFFETEEDIALTTDGKMETYLNQTTNIYSSGSYSEIKYHRNHKDPMELDGEEAALMLLAIPLVMLPMFFIGMHAAHKKWLVNPLKNRNKYKTGMIMLIPIGLILKATFYIKESIHWLVDLSYLGDITLAIGYICLFAFVYGKLFGSRFVIGFENLGKLSLTNYIMQTIICTFIFYGYGLGLFAKMGVTFSIVLGIIIFRLQLYASTLYLKYFKQGPLEWLLRIFIYFKAPTKKRLRTEKAYKNG
ncbi:DUF418 domain-containing protein [Virgibacillus alimentarius]|uniref:DUF418 domain-containing protein n=1 Tax=Virgibacillus alimentarius TaxID=698769 RepID=UPI0004935E14|nr:MULTISPECIES: DUF418 domain-containing protein [Virgibacillus]HLR66534.1 DUF418 domain-containing protein [Virgibacillus sp.]